MYRKKPDVDIILDILKAVQEARPDSAFINSILHQYVERGGLSRKQLEGLYGKALKVPGIPPMRLATLEAEIRRRPERFKTDKPESKPLYTSDPDAKHKIDVILTRYPEHKRALFLRTKLDHHEPLAPADLLDLNRIFQLVTSQK